MKIITLIFFSFLCFVLYQADTGQPNALFELKNHIPYGDKVGHIFMYGTLCFLMNYALKFKYVFNKKTNQFGSLLVLTFSLSEEFSQMLFSTRTFSLSDMAANICAVIIFTFVSIELGKRSKRYSDRLLTAEA